MLQWHFLALSRLQQHDAGADVVVKAEAISRRQGFIHPLQERIKEVVLPDLDRRSEMLGMAFAQACSADPAATVRHRLAFVEPAQSVPYVAPCRFHQQLGAAVAASMAAPSA